MDPKAYFNNPPPNPFANGATVNPITNTSNMYKNVVKALAPHATSAPTDASKAAVQKATDAHAKALQK